MSVFFLIGLYAGAIQAGVGLLLYIFFCTQIHFFLYAVIGICTCVVVGYLVSLATPQLGKDVAGLSLQTLRRAGDGPP